MGPETPNWELWELKADVGSTQRSVDMFTGLCGVCRLWTTFPAIVCCSAAGDHQRPFLPQADVGEEFERLSFVLVCVFFARLSWFKLIFESSSGRRVGLSQTSRSTGAEVAWVTAVTTNV